MQRPQDQFLAAILEGDLAAALSVAQQARSRGMPFVYEDLVGWALVEVGRLWQAGRISVADEHVATAVAQSVLASFFRRSRGWPPARRGSSRASRASATSSAPGWPRIC